MHACIVKKINEVIMEKEKKTPDIYGALVVVHVTEYILHPYSAHTTTLHIAEQSQL